MLYIKGKLTGKLLVTGLKWGKINCQILLLKRSPFVYFFKKYMIMVINNDGIQMKWIYLKE